MIEPIVERAILDTVVNIGQLSAAEIRQLDRAVERGWLSKGKGGPYPILKTVWAVRGFDFVADRQREIDFHMEIDRIEKVRKSPLCGLGVLR